MESDSILDSQAIYWDRAYQMTRRPYWPDETLERWLHTLKEPKGYALDLGCGSGRNLVALAHAGFVPCGIDGSKTAIAAAKRRLEEYLLAHGTEKELPIGWGELVVGGFSSLPWPDGYFRVAVEVNVLEHLSLGDRLAAVKEMARVLAPGGDAFFRMFANPSWGLPAADEAHSVYRNDGTRLHWFLIPEALGMLLGAGFLVRSAELEMKSLMGMGPQSWHWVVWAMKAGVDE